MKSQQHRWKTWLSQVVRHQGGASMVEWIGLIAIVLVALGVSAFALTQNGNVVGGSFARQFECALRVVGIEGVTCDQLDEAEERGIDVPQQTIDPPPSLPAEEGYECQQGESTIGDDGYLRQTKTCSRVSPDNPKAVETCTATATGQDLWEGEAAQSEYSCETTQVVPEPLEDYECTETTSTTADGDQQFDQDCWRVSPDDPGSVEECHNSTVVNAQSLANDTSWNCETQQVAPDPLPAEEGWECNDSTDGNQLTQTCEKREENGDETTITTCTNTTVVQPSGESSGWDCEAVVEREEEKCEWSWNIFKMIWNCVTEYVIEPIAEHVIEPFLGALEDVWEGAKAFLTGEFQALIGIIEGIIEFFKNPSLDALLKILDSACGSMVLQLIPGGGDALGAMCDAKELIESSMDGDVVGIVISALSLLIEALFAFVPGMGDLVGELMDQVAPIIKKLFKSSDEVADTGQTAVRQGDEVVEQGDEVADAADEAPDSDVCITYRGKVRGLASPKAPKRCAEGQPEAEPSTKQPKRNTKAEKADPNNQYTRGSVSPEEKAAYDKQQASVDKAVDKEKEHFWKKDGTKPATTKTVAVVGDKYHHSGYKDLPKNKQNEYGPNRTEDAYDAGNQDGHTFKKGTNDKVNGEKKPGYDAASHAEKQALTDALRMVDGTNNPVPPIAVSKEMCDDCRRFFQTEAKAKGKDITVSDPSGKRVFRKDGSIDLYFKDKNGQLQEQNFGPNVDPTYAVPPNASRGDGKPYIPKEKQPGNS